MEFLTDAPLGKTEKVSASITLQGKWSYADIHCFHSGSGEPPGTSCIANQILENDPNLKN
jgi:hypothetical protein